MLFSSFFISCLIELKFCKVSWNSISKWTWKFQLPILKNKKVLFLKVCFFGCSQYQNKKALFTDSIFREGFGLVVFTFGLVGSQGQWYYHWFSVQLTNDKRERDWNLSSTFLDCLIFRNFLTLFHFWLNIFVGCFIYVLDSSNSSSFTFWSGSQFASSSRSNWTGIWTGNSNGSWIDKQSIHFSTAEEISVKAMFFFM